MEPSSYVITKFAEVCHEANRAYRLAMNEPETDGYSLLSWPDAPDWQKESIIAGVRHKAKFPESTPRDLHNSWLIQKQNDGWVYGPEKNVEMKQHPCMVEYDDLPQSQKAKDYIFNAIAGTLLKQQREFVERLLESLEQPKGASHG